MNTYEAVMNYDVDELADFILGIILETEDNMLNKLSMYGLEISVVQLDENIPHTQIVKDLLEDKYGDS